MESKFWPSCMIHSSEMGSHALEHGQGFSFTFSQPLETFDYEESEITCVLGHSCSVRYKMLCHWKTYVYILHIDLSDSLRRTCFGKGFKTQSFHFLRASRTQKYI